MSWLGKSILTSIFSGQPKNAAPIAQTTRPLTPKEISQLQDCMSEIKDITQTNLLTFYNLGRAQPKPENPYANILCQQLAPLNATPQRETEDFLIECVSIVAKMEDIRLAVAKQYRQNQNNLHLPLDGPSTALILSIATGAKKTTNLLNNAIGLVIEIEPYLDIPELSRIKEKWSAHDKALKPIVGTLAMLTAMTADQGKSSPPAQEHTLH